MLSSDGAYSRRNLVSMNNSSHHSLNHKSSRHTSQRSCHNPANNYGSPRHSLNHKNSHHMLLHYHLHYSYFDFAHC